MYIELKSCMHWISVCECVSLLDSIWMRYDVFFSLTHSLARSLLFNFNVLFTICLYFSVWAHQRVRSILIVWHSFVSLYLSASFSLALFVLMNACLLVIRKSCVDISQQTLRCIVFEGPKWSPFLRSISLNDSSAHNFRFMEEKEVCLKSTRKTLDDYKMSKFKRETEQLPPNNHRQLN